MVTSKKKDRNSNMTKTMIRMLNKMTNLSINKKRMKLFKTNQFRTLDKILNFRNDY